MAIDALLSRLEARPPVTSRPAPAVTRNPAPVLACTSVTAVTAKNYEVSAEIAGPASWAWLVTYPNGTEFRCYFSTEATWEAVRCAHPNAVKVEPIQRELGEQVDLEPADEAAVRGWLAYINETDPELIEECLDRCRQDPESLAYYLGRSAGARHEPLLLAARDQS